MSFSVRALQTIMCSPGISNRRGLRALFWGKPGTGKTAKIESACHAMGSELFTIIASTREPSDFLGLPMPDGKGGVMYAAPAWARAANAAAETGKHVVVYLDELTTCPPSVQAALLRVVNEGWVGELKLHPNVAFIAAANPPDSAAGGYDLAPASANRWIHLDWADPTAAEFSEGILSNWADTLNAEPASKVIARIESNYDVPLAKAKGVVTGFLRANGQHMVTLPPEGSPDASRAWPSCRSWEQAILSLAGGEANHLPDHEVDSLLEGCVGRGVAGELRQYQVAADLPDVSKLLDSSDFTKIWQHNPERPDLTAAVLNSCAGLITPLKADRRKERAVTLWKILGTVVKSAADVAIVSGRAVARSGLSTSKEAQVVMDKMGPVMQAMGEL